MSFVIRNLTRRTRACYVAPPGSTKSYVTRAKARIFPTRAEAEAERCASVEVIEPI